MKPWIGVDLDGTLAHYEHYTGPADIGAPIPAMVERVKKWLAEGKEVRIFTARVWAGKSKNDAEEARRAIEAWTKEHLGRVLPITSEKDFGMVELYDDRCRQVETNTGKLL